MSRGMPIAGAEARPHVAPPSGGGLAGDHGTLNEPGKPYGVVGTTSKIRGPQGAELRDRGLAALGGAL